MKAKLKAFLAAVLVAGMGVSAWAEDAPDDVVVASGEAEFWLGPDEIVVASDEKEFELLPSYEVTVGTLSHMTAAWTSGDGSETNAVEGGVFKVKWGKAENVKVIFTADDGYEIVGDVVVNLGAVTADIVFGDGNDYRVPEVHNSANDIPYLDYDATTGAMTNAAVWAERCTVVTKGIRTLTSGWYAVTNEVVFPLDANLMVEGDVHLVLCDGATLAITNLSGFVAAVDVSVREGVSSSLTIYGQTNGTGALLAKAHGYGAGIGGGKDCDGGAVTINGGIVTAQGGMGAAGIGCGYPSATDCEVTINGGTVTATGGDYAAGIGGGYTKTWTGCVTITGGKVAAEGKDGASAIGPGEGGKGGLIEISGGLFRDEPDDDWLAPGYKAVENTDEATKAAYEYAVERQPDVTVTVGEHPKMTAAYTFGDGAVTNALECTDFELPYGTKNVKVIFAADVGYALDGDAVVGLGRVTADIVFGEESGYKVPRTYCLLGDIAYRDWNGSQMTNAVVSKYDYRSVTTDVRILTDGWWVVSDEVVIPEDNNLTVQGSVHLILCDGATLTVTKAAYKCPAGVSLTRGNSLVIYGQEADTGVLTANGNEGGAGIGGYDGNSAGNITVNGGTVNARGLYRGAGIGGGGYQAKGGTVTINGGTVTAKGGAEGAGIGGGGDGDGGTVIISGGTVTATGGSGGAGIGGGDNGVGGTIVINGGTVVATSKAQGAGIGSGNVCHKFVVGSITINGGTVTATGGDYGAGIGGGQDSTVDQVTINGGVVTATGGAKSAGIGGGNYVTGGKVIITGGIVTATGGQYGAGIGGGSGGAGGDVTISGGAVTAMSSDSGESIGHGWKDYIYYSSGTIRISGGIFWAKPQNGWVVPDYVAIENQDLATMAAYPWAVVPYPAAWPAADDAVMAKFGAWRNGVGADTDLATDTAKDAFLLNVAADGIKELKIESIEVDDEGYAVIVVSAPGAFYFDRINLGEINGILHVEAGKTLETMSPKQVAYWSTTAGKAMIKVKENFIRAAIGFKTPTDVADTLLPPEQQDQE